VKNVYIDFTSRVEILPNNINSVEIGLLKNVFCLDALEAQPSGMNCPVDMVSDTSNTRREGTNKRAWIVIRIVYISF
jgi:hypothetical protein